MIKTKREKAKQNLRLTWMGVMIVIVLCLPISGLLMIRAWQIGGTNVSPMFILLMSIWFLLACLCFFAVHFVNYMDYRFITDESAAEDARKNDLQKTAA